MTEVATITEEERQRRIAEYLLQVPVSCRSTYLKAVNGRSLRAAASFHCYQCQGHERQQIKACENVVCVFWPYRPLAGITKGRKNQRKNSAGFSQAGANAEIGGHSRSGPNPSQYRAAKKEAAVLVCRYGPEKASQIARLTVEKIEDKP